MVVAAAATAAAVTQAAWRLVPGSTRLLRTGFSASECQPEHCSLLLLAAPHSNVLGASYPSVGINNCASRVQTVSWHQSDMQIWHGPTEGPFIPSQIWGWGRFMCGPLKSPVAIEQTGNPNSQDPASQPLAVRLDAHSSSNYVV